MNTPEEAWNLVSNKRKECYIIGVLLNALLVRIKHNPISKFTYHSRWTQQEENLPLLFEIQIQDKGKGLLIAINYVDPDHYQASFLMARRLPGT